MNHPKHIRISEYNYPLPDERIAKYPLPERDSSKLLVYRKGDISEERFTSLPSLLPEKSLMVFNNTKVIQARLHFRKETGALIEVFCLEPFSPADYAQNFQQTGRCSWLCLVGNLKKWKEGTLSRTVEVKGRTLTLTATRGECRGTSHVVEFAWTGDEVSFSELLEAVGELPIPPYLNRATEERDKETYQTVYSKVKGSVAAPTAGLHFTERVLAEIDRRGIEREEVTLHVGAGTFKPVKSEEIGGHEMHTEYISVRRHTIDRLLAYGGKATAVGTTSVRTLESLYYIGVTLDARPDATEEELHVPQWMPYEHAEAVSRGEVRLLTTTEALKLVRDYMERHALEVLHTSTQIIIAPGYTYHIVQRIVTNFHQPQSTLLLLVSAFVGSDWRRIYDFALNNGFRFLSYGDSCLLEPETHLNPPCEGRLEECSCHSESPSDNNQEMFPIVDEEGNITGAATRGECHGGSKLLHPVVHLHLFNSKGELYLQKRPEWKDIQPGKWDTAVGGHVDLGENVEQALLREVREELGVTDFTPTRLASYVFESARERELVYVHRTTYDGSVSPTDELDSGRFWSITEIKENIGKSVFTPNFESEFLRFEKELVAGN